MITLLLCLPAVLQDVDALIGKLKDESVAVRSEAAAALKKAGPPALPKLREALEKATDAGLKTALRDLIGAIELAETLAMLKYEVELPKIPPTLREVNEGQAQLKLKITNGGPREVTLWMGIRLVIADATGTEIQETVCIGKFGLRSEGCILKHFAFRTLGPGKALEIPFTIMNYPCDPDSFLGWDFDGAGTYTLRFTTEFERAAFLKRCDEGCADHADASKPWNRALEFAREFSAKLTVKE